MNTQPGQDVSVLWVAESNWTAGTGIKPHKHDYFHMFMVRQGPLRFTVEDEAFNLDPGECLLVPPNVMHGLCDLEVRLGRTYEVKFAVQPGALRNLLSALPYTFPASDLSEALVRELVEESTRQELSTPALTAEYLTALINFFSRHYGHQPQHQTRVVDTTGYSPLSVEIVRYLEDHYDQDIPLQEVADAVGFNKNYICSAFKRDSGMTIGTCQTAIRIRKAAEMISFSDMNLAQVAAATGFTNLSHFNRIFKKVVGIPPGQYRHMFTVDMLVTSTDPQNVNAVAAQNGFIVSVLSGKSMNIGEIQEFISSEMEKQPAGKSE
mgnify:FL=1